MSESSCIQNRENVPMTFDEWKEKNKDIYECYVNCCLHTVHKGVIEAHFKTMYESGYKAAQNIYKDKIDKVLNHLNLSPVERHTVDILITEDIL